MYRNPFMARQPLEGQTFSVILAPGSKKMVMGEPLAPLPWAITGVVIVPQRCVVVPGPIWLEPLPQLLPELKKVTGRAFEQEAPVPVPVAPWAIYTAGVEAKTWIEESKLNPIKINNLEKL